MDAFAQACTPLSASAGSGSPVAQELLLSPGKSEARYSFYDQQLSFSKVSISERELRERGIGKSLTRMRETFGLRLLLIIVAGPQLLRGFNSHLSASAAPYIYRQYETPASKVAIYDALLRLPNSCGFLVGLTFETLPLFGYKYAPWMALASLAGVAGYAGMCSMSPEVLGAEGVMALLFLTRLQESTVGLAINTQIASKIREYPEDGPSLPAFLWSGNQILSVLAGLAYGPLSDNGRRDPRFSMALCGCVSVLVLVPICLNFHGERRCGLLPKSNSLSSFSLVRIWEQDARVLSLGILVVILALGLASANLLLTPMYRLGASVGCLAALVIALNATLKPEIAKPASFSVLHSALMPSLLSVLFYFCLDSPEQFANGPHLDPMFYNTVLSLVRGVSVVAGLVVYVKVVSHWKYRQIFAVCTILISIAEASRAPMYARLNLQWHIPDRLVLIGSFLVEDLANIWFAMANCMMILRCCPETMQGLYVSLIADAVFLGFSVSRYMGAAVQEIVGSNPRGAPHEDDHFRHLWIASLLCASLVVFRLPLVWLAPDAHLEDDFMEPDAADDKDGEHAPPLIARHSSVQFLRQSSYDLMSCDL